MILFLLPHLPWFLGGTSGVKSLGGRDLGFSSLSSYVIAGVTGEDSQRR